MNEMMKILRPFSKTLLALGLCASAVALTGCEDEQPGPDPIIGDWESVDPVGPNENTLEIDPDMRGEATIYFYQGDSYYYADFDVEVRVLSRGARYEIEFECDGDCASLDFEMDCDLVTDDRLECDADGDWSGYDFEWESN